MVTTDGTRLHARSGYELRAGANPQILLRRVAFLDAAGRLDADAAKALLHWAQEQRLGQDATLIAEAWRRRDRALAALTCGTSLVTRRVIVRPMWRIAVGIGNRANAYEIGLALHGTYGWPIIPASGIKGAMAAWASGPGRVDGGRVSAVCGLPRPSASGDAGKGSVCFLDALPYPEPVGVRVDVVTPHVQAYYGNKDRPPPAEFHQPIPAQFLTVDAGAFALDLLGPATDVDDAAGWCTAAVDELGLGGKTAAGYGYLTGEAPEVAG